jgi:hypothetical protein
MMGPRLQLRHPEADSTGRLQFNITYSRTGTNLAGWNGDLAFGTLARRDFGE